MKRNRQHPDATKKGMTLVEIMVSIMIAAIMGAMMYQVVVITGRVNKDDGGKIARTMQARVFLQQICRDIQCIVSPEVSNGIGLRGTENTIDDIDGDSIQFTRAYIRSTSPEMKIEMKEVFYGVKKVSTKDGFYTTLITKEDDQPDGKIDAPEQALSENPNLKIRLNLRYRATTNTGWQNRWKAEDPLPEAIEVTLEILDPQTKEGAERVNRAVMSRVVCPKSATLF